MKRTGLCSAHGSSPARFSRSLGQHNGLRSSECHFEPRYTQTPVPSVFLAALGWATVALACFAGIGVLLAWRG